MSAQNGNSGYERTDAQPSKILFVTAILVVGTLASGLVSGWIDSALRADTPPSDRHPLAPEGPQVPPEPRLQVRPVGELEAQRAWEREQLEGYAWIDREAGIARVPVELALEMALAEGFPTGATPPSGAAAEDGR